jgi:hypothetical protein
MTVRFLALRALWLMILGFWAPAAGQQAARSQPSAPASVSVQESIPDLASMQTRMRAVSPKTVVVLFDVSGSMEKNDMMTKAREAAIELLRGTLQPGDRAILTAFDVKPETVSDQQVSGEGDIQSVIDKVPGILSTRQGTNIRWAHHQALRMIEQRAPEHSYIVMVTDGFNDPPAASDPHRADYLKYYDARSLTRYPQTAENRDYERLLAKRNQLRVEAFGIGVLIDEDTGRPREQFAAPPIRAVEESAPLEEEPRNESTPAAFNPWWLVGAVALLALLLLAVMMLRPMLSAEDIVLVEGARQAGPFRMSAGSIVELGGTGHGDGAFGVPIPGTSAPIAFLKRSGGAYHLELAPAGEGTAPEVKVNGETVHKTHPLQFSDEIQVQAPRPEGTRAVRFSFERYNASQADSTV